MTLRQTVCLLFLLSELAVICQLRTVLPSRLKQSLKISGDDQKIFGDNQRIFRDDLNIFGKDQIKIFKDDQKIVGDDQKNFEDDQEIFEDDQRILEDDLYISGEEPKIFEDDQKIFGDDQRIFEDDQKIFEDGLNLSNSDLGISGDDLEVSEDYLKISQDDLHEVSTSSVTKMSDDVMVDENEVISFDQHPEREDAPPPVKTLHRKKQRGDKTYQAERGTQDDIDTLPRQKHLPPAQYKLMPRRLKRRGDASDTDISSGEENSHDDGDRMSQRIQQNSLQFRNIFFPGQRDRISGDLREGHHNLVDDAPQGSSLPGNNEYSKPNEANVDKLVSPGGKMSQDQVFTWTKFETSADGTGSRDKREERSQEQERSQVQERSQEQEEEEEDEVESRRHRDALFVAVESMLNESTHENSLQDLEKTLMMVELMLEELLHMERQAMEQKRRNFLSRQRRHNGRKSRPTASSNNSGLFPFPRTG